MSPLYMETVFIEKEVTYGLRDVNHLVQPRFKTVTYSHNTIKYQGSQLWNNLPNDLKKCTFIFKMLHIQNSVLVAQEKRICKILFWICKIIFRLHFGGGNYIISDLKVYGQCATVYWEQSQATLDWFFTIHSALSCYNAVPTPLPPKCWFVHFFQTSRAYLDPGSDGPSHV